MTEAEDDGWESTLADLSERRVAARAMGGEERLAKQRAPEGKLDVRARIVHLLDPGSFQELGLLAGGKDLPADAIVMGSGRIDGRPVMVAAEDFTVKAGTISQAANAKRYRVAELAVLDRVPLVMMLEGAGFRADGRPHARTPTDMLAQAHCSGRVPLVTAVLGPSAGHGALVAPMSDFTVMSAHGSIFTAGPPVVFESLGETVTKEDLGGPSVALASGLIHNTAPDDAAALDLVRAYLTYFPSSAWSYPPDATGSHDVEPRLVTEMLDIVPRNGRRVYDMRDAINVIFDAASTFEVQPEFGRSMVCALARLGGHPVAVIANQPRVIAGSIDVDGADKAARFITVADSFHLPLVFFADNPGVLPGTTSEKRGILRSGARMYAAQAVATSPKFEVTFRKAYGFGSMVMGMIPFDGQSAVFAFPGATMGAMGAAAQGRAQGADEEEAERLRRHELQASYGTANSFGFDELIDPRETRNILLHSLERARSRQQVPAEPVAAHRNLAMIDIPWIVSVDDHVIEPPTLWTSRLPARAQATGPRVERLPAGELALSGARYVERPGTDGPLVDYWVYEDLYASLKRAVAAAGRHRDDMTMSATTYEDIRPGCYEPVARLTDMDTNWTQASLSFPNFPRFCGQTFLEAKDRDLALLCVRAYNDWMVDEWCGPSGGRLIPLCIVPLWDASLAAAEVERNAARGVRAVAFSEIPAYLGLPSIHSGDWDPFFAACEATGTVINLHIGSGSKMPSTSPDAPLGVPVTIGFGNCMNSLADWLFSGKLEQFPGLRLSYAESQIGWIPYLLERADDVWKQHRAWVATGGEISEPPSTYYYRQVSGCFFRDVHGMASLEQCGVDNVMYEVDYPHSDSTWPDSKAVAAEIMDGLAPDVVHKLVRGNAIKLFGLDLPDKPQLASS